MKNPAFAVALSAVLSTTLIGTAHADKPDPLIEPGKFPGTDDPWS